MDHVNTRTVSYSLSINPRMQPCNNICMQSFSFLIMCLSSHTRLPRLFFFTEKQSRQDGIWTEGICSFGGYYRFSSYGLKAVISTFAVWTVVGVGPAGIATVGKLIDLGVDPSCIVWIDPHFEPDFWDATGKVYTATQQ